MNTHFHRRALRLLPNALALALAAPLLFSHTPAIGAPGAHGPGGEHLAGPALARAASAMPRLEAKSDAFELVAELHVDQLVIVIDRYESNEPVLAANLEVESGALKAMAVFRADQGDYVVTDGALLKALAAPGEHGLVFTLVAGKDSDLLEGTLLGSVGRGVTTSAKDDHGHDHGNDDHGHAHELERAAWIGAGIAALGLMGGVAWWRQRRRDEGKLQGGL